MFEGHNLKTWPGPFADLWDGSKNFEVRKFDRSYKTGDIVRLVEFDPKNWEFSGRYVRAEIGYVMAPGRFGLPHDVGVFSIHILERRTIEPHRCERMCAALETVTALSSCDCPAAPGLDCPLSVGQCEERMKQRKGAQL